MIKRIKNISDSDKTWYGKVVISGEYYTIPSSEWFIWSESIDVAESIINGDAILNDGTNDLSKNDSYSFLQEVPGRNLIDHQNKLFIHQSSRPINTDTFYTGADDTGEVFEYIHEIGSPTEASIYADFNVLANITYIHEALVQWKDANRDHVSCQVVSSITPISTGTDYGIGTSGALNGLILPGVIASAYGIPVNKTFVPSEVIPVQMVPDQDTGVVPGAFWDIEKVNGAYDFNTITPNYTGKGIYNLYHSEQNLGTFVRKIPMMGSTSAWNVLPCSDTARLGEGMRIKLIFITRGTDHFWECAISIIMHRENLRIL